jgi:hypothetical protein
MKESLYEQLVRDNPDLFENGECEFSVGNGWYNILACLLGIITSDLNQARYQVKYYRENAANDLDGKKLADAQAKEQAAKDGLPKILQVKEKFGGLRFYYNGGTSAEYIDGAVCMAEAMASRTCEVCGRPGERRGGDWIQTLCDMHYNEQQAHDKARKEGRRLPAINYDEE